MIKELNDKKEYINFINSSEYVLIKFYTTWCGPCKLLTPQYEKASQSNEKVKFASVDAEKNTEVSRMFSINTVPTVILFKNGTKIDSFQGFKTETAILEFISSRV